MKTRYIIMAATTALAVLSGCAKEQDVAAPGKHHLRAAIEQSADTRVSVANDGKATWVAGDEIAVYIDRGFETIEIENPQTGDFTIDALLDPELRSYYAVYPANIATGTSSSAPLQLTLPTTYSLEGKPADYSPVPMIAVNDPDQDILYFRHVGGLLRIICNDVPAGTTTATVTFDKNVTGKYTVNTADPMRPTIANNAVEGAGNTVSFTVPSGATSFVLNVPVPCETYSSVTVQFLGGTLPDTKVYNGNPLVFARQHGKVIAFGIDDFDASDLVLGELTDVETEYTGGKKEIAHSFVSYGTYGDIKVAVPFVLEYSTTGDPDGTDWTETAPSWLAPDATIDFGGSTHGERMEVSIYAQTFTQTDGHAAVMQGMSAADRYPAGVLESGAVNLAKYNVATGQVTGGISTANCYVVRGHGSYKFPAVYGNGVVNGHSNEPAYHGMKYDEDTENYVYRFESEDEKNTFEKKFYYSTDPDETYVFVYGYLAYFKDHLNNDITNPYIAEHLTGSSFTAEVLWSDAPSLVTDVAVDGSGRDTYITFSVLPDFIRQGNAVIGLKDNSGDIVWSWHIWVTDADLNAVTAPNGTIFAPKNLGWCDTVDDFRYGDAREIYIRARQTVTGGKTSLPAKVYSKKGPISQNRGHGTLYQWGRKDPMVPIFSKYEGQATTTVEKTVTVPGNYAPDNKDFFGNSITIGDAIQHPNIAYYAETHTLQRQAWCSSLMYNYWNSQYYGIPLDPDYNDPSPDVKVKKTIYDPSPVGYKVPNIGAFDGISESNFIWNDTGDDPSSETYYGNEGRTYGNVFFPSTGYRDPFQLIWWGDSMYWSASPSVSHHETPGKGLGFNSITIVNPRTRVTPHSIPVRSIRDIIEND